MYKMYKKRTYKKRFIKYLRRTYKNKIVALILMGLMALTAPLLDGDWTAVIFISFIAVPLFFTNKNWIMY